MNRNRIATLNFSWKPLWLAVFYFVTVGGSPFVFAGENAASEPTVKSRIPKKSKAGSAKNQKKTEKSASPTESVASTLKNQPSEPLFAIVNGRPILLSDFNSAYADTVKERFYHGLIPEGQAEVVHKDVTVTLIDRELLVEEAEKRGLVPNLAKFDQVLASYDERYKDEPRWKEERERAIPAIKKIVASESLIEQLRKNITDVPKPTPVEVRAFYQQNPELFTEPENPRLSVILLKVDPSSPPDEWSKTQEKAREIYDRVKGGEDFAKEARLHSSHDSAENGGDLGYLHGGMLSEGLEDKLRKLEIGEVSPPIKMLEGLAIYRLHDRIPAKLQEFSTVESRAQELLVRDRQMKAWTTTLKQLRATASIKYFSPVPGEIKASTPHQVK